MLSFYPSRAEDERVIGAAGERWADILEDFSADEIHAACDEYERSPEKWSPQPGAIRQMALDHRKRAIERSQAKAVSEAPPEPTIRARACPLGHQWLSRPEAREALSEGWHVTVVEWIARNRKMPNQAQLSRLRGDGMETTRFLKNPIGAKQTVLSATLLRVGETIQSKRRALYVEYCDMHQLPHRQDWGAFKEVSIC